MLAIMANPFLLARWVKSRILRVIFLVGQLLALQVLSFAAQAEVIQRLVGKLPAAVSNNAVALVNQCPKEDPNRNDCAAILSVNGLGAGKSNQDIVNQITLFRLVDGKSLVQKIHSSRPAVLASVAVTESRQTWLFGGYTVSSDHTEVSTEQVYRLSSDFPKTGFLPVSKMPVSVDDSVALGDGNGHIYLVSGWHNVGNVSTVQVYNIRTNRWYFATPFPGKPVFGHAAAMAGQKILVTGGVEVSGVVDGKRQFSLAEQAWLGIVDKQDFTKIYWQPVSMPNAASKSALRYRAAMSWWPEKKRFVIIGGSKRPYNYNGIGYDGKPAAAESSVWLFDPNALQWLNVGEVKVPTMDHRGLIYADGRFYTVGGMNNSQQVLDSVFEYGINL